MYDHWPFYIEHTISFEHAWLLLCLLAIVAILRKAFLRHMLRERLRQQYEALAIRIMKAKSILYRISVSAYGEPAPKFEDLPKSRKFDLHSSR